MSAQYLRQARYGTLLVTVALLGVCGGVPHPLPAQSELLDKNQKAFPVAPAAGTGALARPVRDALASVVPSLQQRRFPSEAVRTIGMSGDGRLLWYLHGPAAVRDTHLAADRDRRVRGAQQRRASRRAVLVSSVIAFWPGICRHRRTTGCSSATCSFSSNHAGRRSSMMKTLRSTGGSWGGVASSSTIVLTPRQARSARGGVSLLWTNRPLPTPKADRGIPTTTWCSGS